MTQNDSKKSGFQKFQTSMMNRMAPPAIMAGDSLIYWRVRILFAIMLATFCLCFIALIPFTFLAIKEKLWGLAVFDGIAFLTGTVILFSRRLSYQRRTAIFLLLLYVVGVGIILSVGPLSGGPAWLFSFAVLAGVLLGSRAAIAALGLNAVTLTMMGWLISNGLTGQTVHFFDTAEAMMVAGINFMLLNVVTAISVSVLVKGLVSSHQKKNALSATLARERAHLIKTKSRLEKEIEERKQAQEKNARYNRILESALTEIYIFDAETLHFIEVNRGARKNLGYSAREFAGLSILDLKPELTAESFAEIVQPLRTGAENKIQFTTVHQRKDGSRYPVEVHLQLVPEKSPVFIAMILDITGRMQAEKEKTRLENQYRQAQKMESVGRLAGGIAHDYNNALSVIIGFTEMAMDDVDPAGPLRAHLHEVLIAAGRATDITRQLLAFARKQTIAPRVLDLNENVESMFKMLRHLIGENIDLAWLPRAGLWPIKMDPSQIDQILANLCVNARDAIAGIGKITLETKNTTVDKAFCSAHAGLLPGPYILLTVSDNGCGMDEKTLNHIFEPFFTTKDVDKGTGLGLAMVYGIVKQNKGFIDVSSEPGKGTAIRIYLPRHEGKTAGTKEDVAAKIPLGRGETILLVEDDPQILKLAEKILHELDYTVLPAGSPEKALALAEKYTATIHLLLTDVIMPEMNGHQLVQRLQALYPDIKCLFMSGYTADAIAHDGVLNTGVDFIQKPFSRNDLAETVKKTLDTENKNNQIAPDGKTQW